MGYGIQRIEIFDLDHLPKNQNDFDLIEIYKKNLKELDNQF